MSSHALNDADVTRQAELVVMECLKVWRCSKTLDAVMAHSTTAKSTVASDLYAQDLQKRKLDGAESVLDCIVTGLHDLSEKADAKTSPTQSRSSSRRKASADEGGSDSTGAMAWTKDEITLLKKAIKQTTDIDDKNVRWKEIATLVGNGKSKKHCYLKYKELKEEKGSSRPSSADGRRRSTSRERPSPNAEHGEAGCKETTQTTHETMGSTPPSTESYKTTDETLLQRAASSTRGDILHHGRASATNEVLQMEDCEDFSDFGSSFSGQVKPLRSAELTTLSASIGRSPSTEEVEGLRELLFPEERKNKNFSSHWEQQGLFFSDSRDLGYGLVQNEGGPCGVLAVIQAFTLRYLLTRNDLAHWRNPSESQQQQALASAIAHIVWQAARASNRSRCDIVVNDAKLSSSQSKRRFMSGTQIFTMASVQETERFLLDHIQDFTTPKGNGLVLVVLSVLLSKGLANIKPEMDSVEGTLGGGGKLIGGHDYCTQEMVNLLLCGVACSNVFDGRQLLEGVSEDDPKAVVLKGIPSQCVVGFLSLFEAYEYIVVGSHLKRPQHNIWVICSESHYSVLFADPQFLREIGVDEMPKVDMYYFDGLGNQDAEIRLTVNTRALQQRLKPKPDDLTPPLNLVLQTKWPLAVVEWNGTDPLL